MLPKINPVIQIAEMKNKNWLQSKVLPNMVKALEAMNWYTEMTDTLMYRKTYCRKLKVNCKRRAILKKL